MLKDYKQVDFAFFIFPTAIMLFYSLILFATQGLYSVTYGTIMHTISLFIITCAYVIANQQYKHVPQPRRMLMSLSFIIAGIYFSGIFWETLAHMASGTPEPNMWVVYFNALVGFGLIFYTSKNGKYLNLSKRSLIFPILAITVYIIMWQTGFFYRDVLYNLGGTNPINEPIWLLHKITAIPMFCFSFKNEPENETVDWHI